MASLCFSKSVSGKTRRSTGILRFLRTFLGLVGNLQAISYNQLFNKKNRDTGGLGTNHSSKGCAARYSFGMPSMRSIQRYLLNRHFCRGPCVLSMRISNLAKVERILSQHAICCCIFLSFILALLKQAIQLIGNQILSHPSVFPAERVSPNLTSALATETS